MITNWKATSNDFCRANKTTTAMKRIIAPCVLAGAFAFLTGFPPAYAEVTPAQTFVQQSVDKGIAILKDNSVTAQERNARFHTLLRSIIDFRRVAIFALGSYAHNASDQQIDRFVNAFGDYLMSMLQFGSDQSSAGPHIAVTGSTVRGSDDVLVTATVGGADSAAATGAPMNISFRVRKNGEGHEMIVDILVGGISVAVTQRDELASYLQQHGGSVEQLSAELERRVAAK